MKPFKLQHTIHGDNQKADDLRTLEDSLEEILKNKLKGKAQLNTLNLACGRADETGVLASILGKKADSVKLHGLDLRENEIQNAKSLWEDKISKIASEVECSFSAGKGDDFESWKDFEDPDLIFIRHQNYWFDHKAWVKLYDQALHKLNKDGYIVITSYFDKEHEMARNVLESLGAVEVEHRFNPNSRVIGDSPKITKSVDRHISIFLKAE